SVGEVAHEEQMRLADLLPICDERRVPGETDVRHIGVATRARERLAPVGKLKVGSSDQPRCEDPLYPLELLCPDDPWDGRLPRGHGPRGDPRVLGVRIWAAIQRALVLRRLGREACPGVVRSGRIQDLPAGGVVADRLPEKASVVGALIDRVTGHRLGGEDALVGYTEVTALSDLVPDDPRHRVVGAGEGDVRLDPSTGGVDIERRLARR